MKKYKLIAYLLKIIAILIVLFFSNLCTFRKSSLSLVALHGDSAKCWFRYKKSAGESQLMDIRLYTKDKKRYFLSMTSNENYLEFEKSDIMYANNYGIINDSLLFEGMTIVYKILKLTKDSLIIMDYCSQDIYECLHNKNVRYNTKELLKRNK
jgi:hypothetical protein